MNLVHCYNCSAEGNWCLAFRFCIQACHELYFILCSLYSNLSPLAHYYYNQQSLKRHNITDSLNYFKFTINIWEVILNLYCSWKDKNLQSSISTHSIKFTVIISSKSNETGQCRTTRPYDQIFMQKLTIMRDFL